MRIFIFILFILIFSFQLIIAENVTEVQNLTSINISNITTNKSEINLTILDTQPPNLIINSPSGNVSSLSPEINIIVNDTNIGTCWYKITDQFKKEVIPLTQITNCQNQNIPMGSLSNSIKYIFYVLANDSTGNTNSSHSEFMTPNLQNTTPVTQINVNTTNSNTLNQNITVNSESNTNFNFDLSKFISDFFNAIGNFFSKLFGG